MKSVKEILLHALYKDYANHNMEKSIYMNIPKNNDIVELLDTCKDVLPDIQKDTILFIASNTNSYRVAIHNGYKALYMYDILHYDEQKKSYVVPYKFDPYFSHIIVENCDTFSATTIRSFEDATESYVKLIICYDAMIPKRDLGVDISSLMYKYSGYAVTKINRDKNNTSVAVYNVRNRLRSKKFSMQEFLNDYEGMPPHYNIMKLSINEVANILNINVPIITNNKITSIQLNKEIRHILGTDNEDDDFPKIGEILVTHHPAIALISHSNITIELPKGYRFKIKEVLPLFEDSVAQIVFDHTDSKDNTMECRINISIPYIHYLNNGYMDEEMVKLFNKYPANICYYGYVMHSSLTMDNVYDTGIVWLVTNNLNKYELYNTIVPIHQSLTIVVQQ